MYQFVSSSYSSVVVVMLVWCFVVPVTKHKFTSLPYLRKKPHHLLVTKYFYELFFTCEKLQFLVNIYFHFINFVIYFGGVKKV